MRKESTSCWLITFSAAIGTGQIRVNLWLNTRVNLLLNTLHRFTTNRHHCNILHQSRLRRDGFQLFLYLLALRQYTGCHDIRKFLPAINKLLGLLGEPKTLSSHASGSHSSMLHLLSLLSNGFITDCTANFDCLTPKEVCFHSSISRGAASVVDLAIKPAAGVCVTIETTYTTR